MSTFAVNYEDSVLKVLPRLNDTARVIALDNLSDYLAETNFEKAKNYANRAIRLADSIVFQRGSVVARDKLGNCFLLNADYSKAITVYTQAISLAQQINYSKKISWLFNRLSAAYYYKGDYEEALKNYIRTVDEAKKINNKYTLFEAYNGIANIYMARADYVNTKQYYQEALSIAQELKLNSDIALVEANLGIVFESQHNYTEAMQCYEKALEIYENEKDSASVALTLLNIGGCQSSIHNYTEALKLYNDAINIFTKIGDKSKMSLCYINIATLYSLKRDYVSSIDYFNKALALATETGRKEEKKKCYEELADKYYQTGKFQKAYDYFKMYSDVKDSLFNETNTKSMNELQTKYETEKKEGEIVRLNLDNENKATKIKQQTTFIISVIVISIIGLIGTFAIYKQYREKQKANKELAEKNNAIRKQKRELENQKLIVENQHKEITDSINYARQIQQAILPSQLLISKALPDHFILYKPKAIVSGDFYFFAEKDDKLIMAAVDCTGHGVPGAFMSMIGHNLLTQIINEKGVTQPAEILNQLHKGVRHVLQQDSEKSENRDGMDIALIALDRDMKSLEYAGANRPLYLLREGVINDTKGDKFPIGGLQYELERKFTNHTIQLQKGDSVYMFSDGYADQFGGEKGKKFMVKNLQQILLQSQSKPIHERKNILDTTIEKWRGDHEQIDDILVIGVEV